MSGNPLLEPIHGITLEDYGAACARLGSGLSEDDVAKALGVELPVWQEANLLWPERMKQDATFHIVTLFGQYFGQADQHPTFSGLKASASPEIGFSQSAGLADALSMSGTTAGGVLRCASLSAKSLGIPSRPSSPASSTGP